MSKVYNVLDTGKSILEKKYRKSNFPGRFYVFVLV